MQEKIKALISKYSAKVKGKDRQIKKVNDLLNLSIGAHGRGAHMDTEDLAGELENARTDRKLYLQFVKDLETLIQEDKKNV